MSKLEPKIYVACLSAYNHGVLHGAWIDADQDEEDILKEIQAMLKESPVKDFASCEEWAIHDYEDFGEIKISEYQSIADVSRFGQALAKYGYPISAYYSQFTDLDNFEDYYRGVYESKEDFVYQSFEESGQLEAIEKAGLPEIYINFESIARDWFIDSYFAFEERFEEVHIFSR